MCAVLRPKTASRKILPHGHRRVGRCEHASPRRVRKKRPLAANESYSLPVHFNGRIYDPQLGRMLQADPVQNPGSQGLNRYSYVANNPLSLTDPSGYSWFSSLLHAIDNITGRLVLGSLYDAFHSQWNSFVSNPYVRMVGAIVASYFTFGAVYGAFSAEFVAGTGGAITAGVTAGAASGFVAAAIQTRSFQMAWQGAAAGAIAGGIVGYFGKAQSLQRVGVETIAGGVESKIQGGDFIDGVKFAFFISTLNYANYRMRKLEWERASQRYYNVDGEGEGMYGIGGKLAGSRRESDPDIEYLLGLKCDATAGGCQGAPVNPGDVSARLGPIRYQSDSALNQIAESFAGPHDWLRDMTGSYDQWGNSNHFEGFSATLDQIRNYAEIPIAAPFAAAGLVHETPGVYLPLQCKVVGECK
ncbi:MAG: RHS repeat-associated core domain-containing protein [Rudaea sp.]|uniref:RHS repeat protein n=1 Tax=Rudaea sp. TaxID=2136325 RepID=UPI0039E21E9A